jgi:hypothetical protein
MAKHAARARVELAGVVRGIAAVSCSYEGVAHQPRCVAARLEAAKYRRSGQMSGSRWRRILTSACLGVTRTHLRCLWAMRTTAVACFTCKVRLVCLKSAPAQRIDSANRLSGCHRCHSYHLLANKTYKTRTCTCSAAIWEDCYSSCKARIQPCTSGANHRLVCKQ